MPALPLKPQYGPTLGQLLQPRWHAARRATRALVIVAGIALVALAIALVLTLLDSSYSHGGQMPFSFKYKGLYRTVPERGEYVRIERQAHGQLRDSFAVSPLTLAPYQGSVTGVLPLAMTAYAHTLAGRFAGFRLEGEGKTRISSSLQGYEVLYRARGGAINGAGGEQLYGRDVMLLPGTHGTREGVLIEMLSTEPASIAKPVASSGVLETPLKTFAFG